MTRGLATANATASQASHVRPLLFVELQFAAGTQYLHNGLGTYTWGDHDWVGLGDLGEVSPIEEGDDLSPYGVQMRLSALDNTLLNDAVGTAIFEKRAIIYWGSIGDDGKLVADPDELWSGSMETLSIELGGDVNWITLQAESELIVHGYANGALFTDEDQQKRYSGDVFFQYLDQIVDARVQWGPNATGDMNDVAKGGPNEGARYRPALRKAGH